jgi:hypothetical protein
MVFLNRIVTASSFGGGAAPFRVEGGVKVAIDVSKYELSR